MSLGTRTTCSNCASKKGCLETLHLLDVLSSRNLTWNWPMLNSWDETPPPSWGHPPTKMVHARTHWNETCPNSLARYMNTQHSILKTQYSIFSTADPWLEQRIADKPNYPPCPIMRVKLNEWLNNSHLPSTFKFQFILVWAWALVPLVQIALQKKDV